MQVKTRILLAVLFLLHAILALFWPEPVLQVMLDHRDAEEKRKAQARAAGAVRVGDRA